jgi:hypothetical protein
LLYSSISSSTFTKVDAFVNCFEEEKNGGGFFSKLLGPVVSHGA